MASDRRAIKFGVRAPTFPPGVGVEVLRDYALTSESAGLDSFWLPEHLLPVHGYYSFLADDWVLEPLEALAYVAAITERMLLGTAVALAPFRHPLMWAKMVASLQFLAQGRLILGLGTAWSPEEFDVLGIPRSERGQRTDESIDVLLKAFDGQPFDHDGRIFNFKGATINPVCDPRPRIWGSGGQGIAEYQLVGTRTISSKVVDRLARLDGWLTRPTANVEQMVAEYKVVQDTAARNGRDPSEIVLGHVNFCHLVDGSREGALMEQKEWFARALGPAVTFERVQALHWTGTLDDIADQVQRRLDAGVDHVVVHPLKPTTDQVHLWSDGVVKRLRS